MPDPSAASTKARIGRYAARVAALREQHGPAMVGELAQAELAACCEEYAALKVESAKLDEALSFLAERHEGESLNQYRIRRNPPAQLAFG